MMLIRPSRAAGIIAGCAVLAGVAIPAADAQTTAADSDRVAVADATPSWATPAAKVGSVNPHQQRRIQIALALRDPAGAEATAKAVSNPSSPSYKHFLTSAQFAERFGPTQQSVDQVRQFLADQGLRIDSVAPNKHFIEATGDVEHLADAFGTTLSTYRKVSKGKTFTLAAPSAGVSVPRKIASSITAVIGLDDSAQLVTPAHTPTRRSDNSRPGASPAAGNPNSCSQFWGQNNNTGVPQKYPAGRQSNAICGYSTPQLRSIYSLPDSATGATNTIGIVGAYSSPTIEADVNRTAAMFGGRPLSPGQFTAVTPPSYQDQEQCGLDSWYGEENLDVNAQHAIAPSAGIRYYAASSCRDLYSALNKAVSENRVSVISNSWGYPGESLISKSERDQFGSIVAQAAVQGQAVIFSSGDAGDDSGPGAAGKPEADFPATSPLVTAVGGTSVALNSANKVAFTAGWESSGNTQQGDAWVPQSDADGRFAGGAGGGTSSIYATPDYQQGVVPANGHRAVPDVSALADSYTGFAVGMTTSEGFVTGASGGTSLAAPIMAGLVADAQQQQGIERMGFLNNALYALSGKPQMADVTPVAAGVWTPAMSSFGHVSVPSGRGSYLIDFDTRPQSIQTARGWDPVTGVGTPTAGFLSALGK